ncbi:alginate export family protein [Phaeodactylibacter sp.]|uniref:alginate export family protein n=1 Tax=Phaeodactylibacter sp. TaxID=1940289 RepID=UPI0025D37FF6|nr:alginate export family protein [Phaeodactylibacter sp.]MCI4651706.1 alginate export family protein [Phaeodactylibacter sp.]MCI5090838.1 alginate export family protein [Phaeodactylibacter sp.]
MKYIFTIYFIVLMFPCFGQPGPIKIFRYFDDFSYLQQSDSLERNWYEKLKFIPLHGQSNISFGGEVREMYQYFDNQNFGDIPPFFETDSEGFLWHRAMVHSNLRFNKRWRLFTQLNSTYTLFKRNPLTPEIDENRLSLHQAFVRVDLTNEGDFIQAGRQEFGKGTQLIIGMREGPNTRLTFDAFLIGSERQKRNIYAFIATPVISMQGVFDDKWIDELIWTFYVVNKLGKDNLDVYYFGFHGSERVYNEIQSTEDRQTIGLRYWRESKGLNYSLESNYQFGNFNTQNISAYNISFEGDKAISDAIGIGMQLNYISGDQDPNDKRLNTYNLLYSKPQFGLAAPIGSTNLINLKPFIILFPFKKFRATLSNYWIWRQSDVDGVYTPAAVQIRPSILNDSDAKFLGNQSTLELFYALNTNFQFFLDYALFQPGAYVKNTGKGETLNYFSFKTSFKF